MEQILVTKPDGQILNLRLLEPVRNVTKAEQFKQLLGEDTVKITVETSQTIDFGIGDKLKAFGEDYFLNAVPKAQKTGDRRFVYDLTFEGSQYDLLRAQYFNTDVSGFNTTSDFSLTADLRTFVTAIISNANRVFDGKWIIGEVPNTDTKTLSFNEENCLSVLQKLCQEFDYEFEIVQSDGQPLEWFYGETGLGGYEINPVAQGDFRTINIKKLGQVQADGSPLGWFYGETGFGSDNNGDGSSELSTSVKYEYGKGRGLYQLSRENINDKNIVTRLYAFGGNKNIKNNYRNYSPRLRMNTTDSYIEKTNAKATFGLIEGVKNFEDIFPHREASVTSIGADKLTFVDATMDFDLNEKDSSGTKWLISGVNAKIHFNSGGLAGYEFEIESYTHSTKTFKLLPFKDERGLEFPGDNSAFKLQSGDRYVILDINMPDSYVSAAETLLKTKAEEYLEGNSAPRVQYALEVDERFLIDKATYGSIANFFEIGDLIAIKDTGLNIDKSSRIISFTRDLLYPYRYKLNIADSYDVTLIERLISDNADIKTVIKINDLRDASKARQNWRTTEELKSLIFDKDGYFDGGKIKPETIETLLIQVGAKTSQFILNIIFEPNYGGNMNVIKVNAGALTHFTIETTIRTWQISALTTTIIDNNFRYIYAKCSRSNGNDAQVIFSVSQIGTTDDANYYHFLVGVLSSVDPDTNDRSISLTYGATTISGRFIKTGRIQSADQATYFDLDSSEIGGNIKFIDPSDGTKKGLLQLTQTSINGGVVTSGVIQLSGVGGNVLAGITGEGTSDSSVRFWAGSSYVNRNVAPFRVLQSGEVFARKRIEMMNESNVGQAGICGANTSGDGTVRIWAGSDYAGRESAPFRVHSDGAIYASKGQIGGFKIIGNSLTNQGFNNEATFVARNDTNNVFSAIGTNVNPPSSGSTALGRFENNQVDAFNTNIGAKFQASGGADNFAIIADLGKSMFLQGLLNGRSHYKETLGNVNRALNPKNYDVVNIYPTDAAAGISFTSTSEIRDGKQVIVINSNNGSSMRLYSIVRGISSVELVGGASMTLTYSDGYWYVTSFHDNEF